MDEKYEEIDLKIDPERTINGHDKILFEKILKDCENAEKQDKEAVLIALEAPVIFRGVKKCELFQLLVIPVKLDFVVEKWSWPISFGRWVSVLDFSTVLQ